MTLRENKFQIKNCTFEEVLPLWKDHLWLGRKSKIEAVSPISKELTFNAEIKKAHALFWKAITNDGKLAGVISGYQTDPCSFRVRGLYVQEKYRGLGLSQLLLMTVRKHAILNECTLLWTLPRKSAWACYKNFGFTQKTDWFEDGMEFGPNCLAFCDVIHADAHKIDKKIQ